MAGRGRLPGRPQQLPSGQPPPAAPPKGTRLDFACKMPQFCQGGDKPIIKSPGNCGREFDPKAEWGLRGGGSTPSPLHTFPFLHGCQFPGQDDPFEGAEGTFLKIHDVIRRTSPGKLDSDGTQRNPNSTQMKPRTGMPPPPKSGHLPAGGAPPWPPALEEHLTRRPDLGVRLHAPGEGKAGRGWRGEGRN